MTTDRVSISLVIATVSRPTLIGTLRSLVGQDWRPGDEVLLVGDGPQPIACDLFASSPLPGRYLTNPTRTGVWGHYARNWVLDAGVAAGTHLMALDDDDEYTPGAIATVREHLQQSPHRPHIYRMSGHPDAGTVWKEPVVRVANLGTPMLVFPNSPRKLGRYAYTYTGDYEFCSSTLFHYPEGPIWKEDVICRVRPWRFRD